MNKAGMDMADRMQVENVLAHELAHGDVVLGTLGPVLGHLLAGHAHTLFSDRIVAQVRGMIAHVAAQLTEDDAGEQDASAADTRLRLAQALSGDMSLVSHCHALALEHQLTERLQAKNAIDPVLPPLVQLMIASDDPETAATAMATLVAQARFIQQLRRMELPLGELPENLFAAVLDHARELAVIDEAGFRTGYDAEANRLGLLARLVEMVDHGGQAALIPSHSGVALFLSALAAISGQSRDLAAISTDESQLSRLALALRAAGLKHHEIEEQFLLLHPTITLPDNFDSLRADRAGQLLADSEHKTLG